VHKNSINGLTAAELHSLRCLESINKLILSSYYDEILFSTEVVNNNVICKNNGINICCYITVNNITIFVSFVLGSG